MSRCATAASWRSAARRKPATGARPTLDDRFADKVLMPGLVEGHSHAWEGGVWKFPYVGYFDRHDPEGRRWPGLRQHRRPWWPGWPSAERPCAGRRRCSPGGSIRSISASPRMTARPRPRLDRARPVVVLHSNGHVMNVNTPVLERAASRATPTSTACAQGRAGRADRRAAGDGGQVHGLSRAGRQLAAGLIRRAGGCAASPAWPPAGVTTATDLLNELPGPTVAAYVAATRRRRLPAAPAAGAERRKA